MDRRFRNAAALAAAALAATFALAWPARAQFAAQAPAAPAANAVAGAPGAAGNAAASGANAGPGAGVGPGVASPGAATPASTPVAANDPAAVRIRAAVDAWLRGRFKVDEVRRTPVPGIWEVRIGSDLMYADEQGQYVFVEGQMVEMRSNRSLTQERVEQLSSIQWKDLPLDIALKQVNGKGRRVVAVFEDPNCPHCRNTRRELNKIDDLTIYTFTYPILAADSEQKVRQAWCASDKLKAWNELVMEGKVPGNPGTCAAADKALERTMELGRKLRVQGTPTLFFANGKRIPGGLPGPALQKMVDENSRAS